MDHSTAWLLLCSTLAVNFTVPDDTFNVGGFTDIVATGCAIVATGCELVVTGSAFVLRPV